MKFKGQFIRYSSGEMVRVEPENPFFKPGLVYQFIVKEIVIINESLEKIIIVSDKYGFTHHVILEEDVCPSEKIDLRVERIRKGWPILIPV